MTTPSITVEGARELRAALKAVEGGIADLKTVHADAAGIVEKRAGEIVPRLSGALFNSLRSSGQQTAGVVRAGSAGVPYAGIIHFGSAARNIRPQPYLYDAIDDRRKEVVEVFEQRVNELIKKNDLD